jgi:hypothetical protein
MSTIEFQVIPLDDDRPEIAQIIPFIDGWSLVQLVGDLETTKGYDPAATYAGLVPANVRLGDLDRYYTGTQEPWSGRSRLAILGCECGEYGCWPLDADVRVSDGHVIWSSFGQPHRPDWDYSELGPFVFDEAQYRHAVEQLKSRVEST